MRCVELKVADLKGTPLVLLEMGGVPLENGQRLIVDANVADRLVLQYKPHLVKVGQLEREKLQGIWYELHQATQRAVDEPKKLPAEIDSAEESPPEDMSEVKSDKAMTSKKAKKKVRKK